MALLESSACLRRTELDDRRGGGRVTEAAANRSESATRKQMVYVAA